MPVTSPRVLKGAGTKLKFNGAVISQRTSIKPGGPTVDEREATDLDSVIKIFRPALPDLGTVDLEINYDPADATHSTIEARAQAPKYVDPANDDAWILELPDGDAAAIPAIANSTISFKGWVQKFERGDITPDGNQTATITVRITSVPILTVRA